MCKSGISLCILAIILGFLEISAEGTSISHHAAFRLHSHKASRRHRAVSDGALRFEPAPFSRTLEMKSFGKVHCKVAGGSNPVVQWFLNDLDPLPDGVQSVNGTLLIAEVLDIHRGTYTCQAKDGDKVIATKITLGVVVSPHIISPTQDQQIHVSAGTDVFVHCVATGDPAPQVTWDRDLAHLHTEKEAGDVLEGDNNASNVSIVVFSNGTLLLRNVSLSASARYGCVAGNAGGLDRHEMYLHVHPEGELPADPSTGNNKAIIVSVSVAGAYMVLVLALMLYCRRRRRERGEKIEIEMAEGREKLVEDEEDKQKIGNGSAQNGRLLAHDKDSGADNSESCVSRASKRSGLVETPTVPRTLLTEQITLGRGEFGDVLLAKIDMVQVKRLRGKDSDAAADLRPVMVKALTTKDENQLAEFRRQIELFSRARHDNIVKLIALSSEADPHYAIFDHTDWGDLKHFLIATRTPEERSEYAIKVGSTAAAEIAANNNKRVSAPLLEAHAALLAAQLARANAALAHRRMTHRDIAARNCLITSSLQLKLSLPGLTRGPHAHEYYKLHDQVIPLRWLPLEVVTEGEYSTKSDVYMFAATVWEIYTKAELPFAKLNDNSVMERLKSGTLEWTVPDSVPGRLAELLKKCWSKSPADRPLFDSIAEEINSILQDLTSENVSLKSQEKIDSSVAEIV